MVVAKAHCQICKLVCMCMCMCACVLVYMRAYTYISVVPVLARYFILYSLAI